MIYIDPPYNTEKKFMYNDTFRNKKKKECRHSGWLNMIYPRLKIAKDLLSNEGAIFMHIDENEVNNLQKICSEIFGDSNELGTIIWDKRNPKGSVVGVAYQHESVLVYCKDKMSFANASFSKTKENAEAMLLKAAQLIKKEGEINEKVRDQYKEWIKQHKTELSGGESMYNLIDEYGRVYRLVSMAAPDKPETRSHRPLIHPITGKPCPIPEKGWRYTDKTMDEMMAIGKIGFGIDERTQPQNKYYLNENMEEAVSSLIYFGGSDDVMGLQFDNPKPKYISERLIKSVCKGKDDIILDFFSGSATTAHSVMQLNSEDGGNRKYIMVQLPEETDENSEAYKAGYKNICEIGKERIRRAGEKIKADKPNAVFDDGFKVYKIN